MVLWGITVRLTVKLRSARQCRVRFHVHRGKIFFRMFPIRIQISLILSEYFFFFVFYMML